MARHLPTGRGPILDAGCGTGLVGEALSVLGYDPVIGCDLSQGMLDHAARRGGYADLVTQDMTQRFRWPEGPITRISKIAFWWGYLDLNQGPIGYEPTALTTELYPRRKIINKN